MKRDLEHKPDPQTIEPLTSFVPAEETKPVEAFTSRERLLAIMEKANDVARSENLEALFSRTLDLLIDVSGAESAILFLYDPGSDELVFTTVRGDEESQGLIGLRLKKHLWLVDPINPRSKVIIVGDVVSDPLLRIINPVKAGGLHNTIIIPLLLEEKVFGVIQIFNYSLCDLDLLETLGNRFVNEADRLMTLEVTQQSNQRLKLLIDMIGKVSGTLDRSQLLQVVPEQAARLTNAERSSLFLVDSTTNELGFHSSYYQPATPVPAASPAGRQQQLHKLISSLKAGQSNPSSPAEQGKKSEGFGFATRSAITVPLNEIKIARTERKDQPNTTIGGLTVLKMRGEAFDEEDVQLLETLAHQASIFLQAAELYENINDLFLDVIKALVAAIDAKDRSTQGHSVRVLDLAVATAQEMGLDPNTVSDIRIGSLLHDVGKIGISDQILSKPGRLTPEEFKIMKKHPLYGRQIMSQVRVLQSALPGIAEHHERLDGSGYPYGLIGDQISIAGRVIAVADVFDALTSDRPYRKGVSVQAALDYLNEESGKLFDRDCVQALTRIIERRMAESEPAMPFRRNDDGRTPSSFPQDLYKRI